MVFRLHRSPLHLRGPILAQTSRVGVELRPCRLLRAVRQVTMGAVDHLHARAHVAGELDDREAGVGSAHVANDCRRSYGRRVGSPQPRARGFQSRRRRLCRLMCSPRGDERSAECRAGAGSRRAPGAPASTAGRGGGCGWSSRTPSPCRTRTACVNGWISSGFGCGLRPASFAGFCLTRRHLDVTSETRRLEHGAMRC